MACAFFILLVAALLALAGLGALAWFGWRRVAAHLDGNPEAARLLAEHVITPLLLGKQAPEVKPQAKPEVQKTKGTLV